MVAYPEVGRERRLGRSFPCSPAENRLRRRPQKNASRSDLRTSTTARSGPARIHPTLLCRWYLKVQLGGAQPSGLLGRGCSSAARARPPVHADAPHLGRSGAVEGTGDPAGAVASQVAGRSGRARLPRPPSLPGSRLHFQATRRILTGTGPLMLNDRIGGLRRGGRT
jgi:hypothetical protein